MANTVQDRVQDDELVMGLVDLALACPPEERERYVHSACGPDPALFKEVWKYVEAEQRMNGFLLDPLYAPPGDEHPFEPGQLLDGRFRIERELAEGGMGVVYEAIDERLDKRIAVKTAKIGFRKRLPPEVRSATAISHPNVCKIFEIHTAATDQGEVDFLTMEFLDGETLADRLKRGPLPEPETQDIARQLCAGLAEAHRNQVIHGDLKSSNVILTRPAGGGIRAVITDFGLARRPDATQQTIQTGDRGGTPDYMAPELWKGEKASAASDIYALGVILYEMIAGRRPYSTAASWDDRLGRKPAPVHPKWDRILAGCLEPDPARRFGSADEIAAALVPRSRRWLLAAAAAIGLAATTGIATYRSTVAPPENVRLAVLPFETDPASRALSDGLLNDTAERLRQVKAGGNRRFSVIPLSDTVRPKVDRPEKAAKLLGATHVITGTLRWNGGRAVVHAFLSDVEARVPIKDWAAEYSRDRLQEIPMALAGMVTGTLRLPALPTATIANPAAYADFTRGVGLLQRSMTDEAIPLLESAAKADPDSPLTHARLAEAQLLKYKLTNDPNWLSDAIVSFGNAQQRNPDTPEVWLVSGMINESVGAYEKARDDIRRALDIEPQNGDGWWQLGKIFQDTENFADALTAYQKGIELQPGHFANYEGLCYLYADLGNYDEGIPHCLKLVAVAPDFPEAHLALAYAYGNWGHYADAEREARVALKLDPTSAKAFHTLATVLAYEGRYEEAISSFQSALRKGSPTYLLYLNLGMTLQWAGRVYDARDAYRQGLALAKAMLVRNSRDGSNHALLGYLYAKTGENAPARAEAILAQQLSGNSVNTIYWLVRAYEALGDRERALALASEAPPGALRFINRQPDLAELRSNPRFQDSLRSHHIQ